MVSSVSAHSSVGCRCALDAGDSRRLGLFLALVLGFAAVEWLVGNASHSLALRSDAGHMLTDVGAIALALSASWLARQTLAQRPSGWPRLEAIAALVNGLGVLGLAVLIFLEAGQHLAGPTTATVSGPMLGTAVLGLGINGFGVWLLHGRSSLSLRGALLHVVADLASSIGVVVGAVCMALFQWCWVDGALSLAIALLIGGSALPLIRQSWASLRQQPTPDLVALGFLETGRTDLTTHILNR